MSINKQTVRVGEWVRAEYPGNPLDPVFLGVGNDKPTEWMPAFFEDGQALIRFPNLHPGSYYLWLKQGDEVTRVSIIKAL